MAQSQAARTRLHRESARLMAEAVNPRTTEQRMNDIHARLVEIDAMLHAPVVPLGDQFAFASL
jgi:hypothetical protein